MTPMDGVARSPLRAVLMAGPPGAGKTTTMWEIHELMKQRGIPHAMIETDLLPRMWPAPPDDPHNVRFTQQNVRIMADTFRQHGARWLFIVDIVNRQGVVTAYRQMLPDWEITVIRFVVEQERLIARLHERETAETIGWYLERAARGDEVLDREGIGDIILRVGSESPTEVAEMILVRLGIQAS